MSLVSTYNLKERTKFTTSLILGIIYASSDEIHQMYSPGRSAKISDVYIDTLGILLGILAIMMFIEIYKKIKERNQKKAT